MPVYIDQDDALAKMTQVEGEFWLNHMALDQTEDCSFMAFKLYYEQEIKPMAKNDPENLRRLIELGWSFHPGHSAAIYGNGGWNRYRVQYDGEIIFMEAFATDEGIAKAKAAGFRTEF